MSERWKLKLKTQDIENCCPWIVGDPDDPEGKPQTCNGTVTWTVGSSVGVCRSCGADVLSILEM